MVVVVNRSPVLSIVSAPVKDSPNGTMVVPNPVTVNEPEKGDELYAALLNRV
jgi:hypothetical protein